MGKTMTQLDHLYHQIKLPILRMGCIFWVIGQIGSIAHISPKHHRLSKAIGYTPWLNNKALILKITKLSYVIEERDRAGAQLEAASPLTAIRDTGKYFSATRGERWLLMTLVTTNTTQLKTLQLTTLACWEI